MEKYNIRHMVKSYAVAFRMNQPEKYNKIRDELAVRVSEMIGTTAMGLRNYASQLQASKKFIESLLFLQISVKFRDESDPINGWTTLENKRLMECIQKSLAGIYTSLIHMPEKLVFFNQVTDIVQEYHDDIAKNEDLGPKTAALNQAWCLLTLGSMHFHVRKNFKDSEEAYENGLNTLTWIMGNGASKHWVYSALCLGMADIYHATSRDAQAKRYYERGAEAMKCAEDFAGEEEKLTSVKTAEKYVNR